MVAHTSVSGSSLCHQADSDNCRQGGTICHSTVICARRVFIACLVQSHRGGHIGIRNIENYFLYRKKKLLQVIYIPFTQVEKQHRGMRAHSARSVRDWFLRRESWKRVAVDGLLVFI